MSRSSKNIYTALKALLGERPGSAFADTEKNYREYLERNTPSMEELEQQRREKTEGLPMFAIAMAREGADSRAVQLTADSLAAQTYSRWEVTDAPQQGDWQYIMYMWPGDTLSPDALYRYAQNAQGHDLIYCDEDVQGKNGREAPVFKTEADIITQLSQDMLGSGVAVSRALYEAAGPMAGDTADDRYGYNLRCLKMAASPCHIPRVMYTCGEYRQTTDAARAQVAQAAGKGCMVMPGEWRGSFQVEAIVRQPGVAVIISNRDSCQMLIRLLMSIDRAAGEHRPKIIIADQGSTDSRTLRYYDILRKNRAASIYMGGDTGLAALLNGAAGEADGDVAVFMESTAEVLSHNWVGGLLHQAMRQGVGAAGPKILSPDGRLLHCGTVIGMQGWRGSPYQGSEDDMLSLRKRSLTGTVRRVSALSSICMMVRLETFFNVGCFDESFSMAGFDTELCLRMAGRGYASVYTPGVLIRSGKPIASMDDACEQDRQRCYDGIRETLTRGDDYYSINYDYSLSCPEVNIAPRPPIYLNPMFNEK